MATAQFGMIGLAVMGQNLAENIEEHGFSTAVWNLETDWVDKFVTKNKGKKFTGTKTLEEFVKSLERPRRIMMMIKAGKPVDLTLERLAPLLETDDIVIDGGNSFYEDTRRREADWAKKGLRFVGMGVSGGEEGARHGPSLMPGGDRKAYDRLAPVLTAIAAKADKGPCVTYVGPDGAGHFVKTVHNGIEYAVMQLIAEAYDMLRRGAGLSLDEIGATFDEWNKGPLESFLVDLTAKICRVKDPETKKAMLDLVLDKAGQKGTGKWTAQVALDLAVPVPTIAAAIDARVVSSMKDERVAASKKLKGPSGPVPASEKAALVAAVRDALYAATIGCYAQGMSLIRAASNEFKWSVNLAEMARIWRAGCIIRAKLLDPIQAAFEKTPGLPNLLVDPELSNRVMELQGAWRKVVVRAVDLGIPVPAHSTCLAYFDSYRTASLPQSLTQAQRDAFGAHTFERTDKPEKGFVHFDWLGAR
ncbi:MAG TPA: NADP-dependent phosphogluconate dehydrogenase [Planctomycetota bacterium]|nr:NADP-dependent phosphogluconate dehydrogenase [Planctomycetota bacterium]